MPLVESFCHTNSAELKISQRGRGFFHIKRSGGYYTFYGFSFLQLVFLGYVIRESHKITWNISRHWLWKCSHLTQTDHLIWMSPAMWEKLSLPFIPGLLWCNYLLFRSFPVFNSQHFNGWMQDAILLKTSTDIWLEFALLICFYAGQMSSWLRWCLGTWLTHLHEATRHSTLEV